MKNLLFFVALIAFFSSCKEEGILQIDMLGLFDGQRMQLNKAYAFGDIDIKFENLAFYMTDLVLVNENNEEVKLADVEFIELGEDLVYQRFYKNLPGGNYKKLKFNIGVTEDLNAKVPSDFNVTDALGRSDHYWEAWDSYIFSKTEGSADVDGNGVFDLKWFFHTGSDALLRSVELEKDILLVNNANVVMAVDLDYDLLLRNADGSAFDIEANPRNHNPNEMEQITKLVDNYANAFLVF